MEKDPAELAAQQGKAFCEGLKIFQNARFKMKKGVVGEIELRAYEQKQYHVVLLALVYRKKLFEAYDAFFKDYLTSKKQEYITKYKKIVPLHQSTEYRMETIQYNQAQNNQNLSGNKLCRIPVNT